MQVRVARSVNRSRLGWAAADRYRRYETTKTACVGNPPPFQDFRARWELMSTSAKTEFTLSFTVTEEEKTTFTNSLRKTTGLELKAGGKTIGTFSRQTEVSRPVRVDVARGGRGGGLTRQTENRSLSQARSSLPPVRRRLPR